MESKVSKERNYGIDLLRLVCMFMIVVAHLVHHGSAGGSDPTAANYSIAWFIAIFNFSSVNIFALISGYGGYSSIGRQGKTKKVLSIWFQVFFYSVLVGWIMFFVSGGIIETPMMILTFFPVASDQYWYFSSYIGVLILSPWINDFVRGMTERAARTLMVVIVSVFAVYNMFAIMDPFKMNGGSAFVWLFLLYIVGALLRKLEIPENLNLKKWIPLAIVSFIIVWVLKCFGGQYLSILIVQHCNIFFFVIALTMIAVFVRIKPKGAFQTFIKVFSPAAFGVYLIHDNQLFRALFVKDKFMWIADENNFAVMLLIIIGISLGVFVACLFIEKFRLLLFKWLHINQGINRLGDCIERTVAKKIRG